MYHANPNAYRQTASRKRRGVGSVSQIMVCICRVVADNVIVWVCLICLDGVASTEERGERLVSERASEQRAPDPASSRRARLRGYTPDPLGHMGICVTVETTG